MVIIGIVNDTTTTTVKLKKFYKKGHQLLKINLIFILIMIDNFRIESSDLPANLPNGKGIKIVPSLSDLLLYKMWVKYLNSGKNKYRRYPKTQIYPKVV